MISTEDKQKIAKCLDLSLQIEGSTFYNNQASGTVSVYNIVHGIERWSHRAWYSWNSVETLDQLITALENHINETAK